MFRFLVFILIASISFSGCHYFTGINENGKPIENIVISKTDSTLVDSMMPYCYHVVSRFRKGWPMQGSAFYLDYKKKVYLFSALHNFTGIDPESNKLLADLPGNPKDLMVWQSFEDRVNWLNYYKFVKYDSFAYAILKDSFLAYKKLPDAGKDYKLYSNDNALFLGARTNNTQGNNYDIGAYDVSDSFPMPRNILGYDPKWNSEMIHVGDSIFYWSFLKEGDHLAEMPNMFVGKIIDMPSFGNQYITSDVFSRPGSSGAAVFKISNHRVSLIGVITRGNADKNIVYISPIKETLALFKL